MLVMGGEDDDDAWERCLGVVGGKEGDSVERRWDAK